VPYDYMHLVCIGVVKKIMSFWISVKHRHNLPPKSIAVLDNKLTSLAHHIPVEFQRKPSEYSRTLPLKDINRWKATELRQCLLYTGIVLFKNNIIDPDIYNHFLVLSIAMRILLSNKSNQEYLYYAQDLLKYFVDTFKNIYGINFVSHNVHALVHLAQDALKHGPLDYISISI